MHCEHFPLRKLCSRLSHFSRESGEPSAPCGSGPASAEMSRKPHSWGSQVEPADESERGMNISLLSVAGESKLLDDDVLSLTSSDSAVSALLTSSQEEQAEAVEIEDVSEHSQTACPA
ncbi:hypothetical protein DPX16_8606 [Anabarilius grahami]|uniref:Uncharacterized protein n=1 Tax=Anabarilius grahami TaxID=495550 RepID=A0A3N0YAL7_ANAGA|nr:hypothetical protein DPX16_8606 [Anabarilius grahami]